jgi:hypothetical protein
MLHGFFIIMQNHAGLKNMCKKTRKTGVGQNSMGALFSVSRSVGGPNQGCACRTKNIN